MVGRPFHSEVSLAAFLTHDNCVKLSTPDGAGQARGCDNSGNTRSVPINSLASPPSPEAVRLPARHVSILPWLASPRPRLGSV